MRRLLLSLSLVVLAPAGVHAQDTRAIEPEDYYRVQRVSSPALSPDGRHLLYQVETVRQETNDRINHIWWADLGTGQTRRLSTRGINSTAPGWTPDGRRIHFRTERGGESGLHFLDFAEPGGEAYRIPALGESPHFHPDGTWALVARSVPVEDGREDGGSDDDAEEGSGEAPRPPTERRTPYWPSGTPALTASLERAAQGETEEERNRDVYVITHDQYKRDGTLAFVRPPRDDDREEAYTQFFRVPADGLEDEEDRGIQLTHDHVGKSFRQFSRDGRWIVYTAPVPPAEPSGDEEEDESVEAEAEEEEEDTGIFRLASGGGEGELIHQTSDQVRSVAMSPDGGHLAYVTAEDSMTDPFIRIVSVPDGEVERELASDDWIYSIGSITWSEDGAHLYWVSAIGGQDQLVRVPTAGGEVERVTEGRHTYLGTDINVARNRFAYVKSTAERPWELFISRLDGSGEEQVTALNEEWLAQVRLSRVEHFTYTGVAHDRDWLDQLPERGVEYMLANDAPDGERFEIDGWLVYPQGYEEGRSYPMVVSIHGGPHSRYADTWFPEFQMLAAQGMFVLYTNPRGSSGYGMEFQYSTLRAWGIDDLKDILQGVELVVERGLADPERLGVTGGSYGGFMTSWITAHDQRWRAALTARGIVNWLSFYGVSDVPGLIEREFGGMPWPFRSSEEGSYELVMKLSPIVWADRVETPTLIIHSINDYRTPLEGAEQWYRALRKHEVPVKMILFPDSSHGLSRTGEPWLLVRRLHEYMDWFRHYLVEDETTVADDDDL
jgi:dipeptidyl aminopeptidase/acylaminoacyl peptidase